MKRHLAFVSVLLLCACERSKSPDEQKEGSVSAAPTAFDAGSDGVLEKQPKLKPYVIPERTGEQLHEELKTACRVAAKKNRRLLVEFSAEWCGDCRRLAEMKEEKVLRQALAEAPHYVVNVGRFDRHEGLLKDFKIRSIANWQVVDTTNCDGPVSEWPKVKHRTLEPQTGSKKVSAAELAGWLKQWVVAPG